MKVIPISAYLNEFDVEPVAEFPTAIPENFPVEFTADPIPVTPAEDLEKRFREGVEEGKREAKIEFDQDLKAQEKLLSDQHTQSLASIHEHFAEQFHDQLNLCISELETKLSDTLAEIVKPFVSELLKNKMVYELRNAITETLRDSDNCQLTVKGPAAMLKRLEASLDDAMLPIEFTENNDLEVSVEIAQAKIETRLQLWSKLVEREIG